jgi:hypothetical protein
MPSFCSPAACMHMGRRAIVLTTNRKSAPGKIPAPVVVEQKQASLWHHKTTRQRAAAAVVQRRWRLLSQPSCGLAGQRADRASDGSRAERGLVQVLSVPAIGTAKPCIAAIHACTCTQPHQ